MSNTLTPGLPVSGYRPQSGEALDLVNLNKAFEERVLRILDGLAARPDVDPHWLNIGRAQIEMGFMAVNRAVFRPTRASLPEDAAEIASAATPAASLPSVPVA